MRIGVMNHPARNPLEEIEWIGGNGFDFVDFTLEPPAADPDQIDAAAIRAALDRHRLGVVAHTAYYIPLASPFDSIRAASLSEFRRALRSAHEIGATVMNVHYGRGPGFFSKDDVIDWHAEVLSQLCEEAKAVGVTIVLEHIPFGGSEQLETIVQIMERVRLLRFHLDSGHAKLERGYDRCSTTEWPQHVKTLKATGYDGTITLEVFSPHREYVLLSRDLFRRWWEET